MPLLTPEFVRIASLVTGTIVAMIAAYKFVIQRPRLQLTAEHDRDFFYDDLVRTNLRFVLSNSGFRYAEDVYLEIYLPDWNFGELMRNAEIGVTVSTVVDGERQVDEKYGAHHDSSEDGSEINEEGNQDSEQGNGDNNGQIGVKDSVLDLRHDLQTYILAPGERNHIFVNNIIYNGTSFDIFGGEANVEQFRSYTIEYRVGCRTYGPRKGEIEIESRYDDFEITHSHPRFYWAWYNTLKKFLFEFLSFSTSSVDKYLGVDLSIKAVRMEDSKVKYEDISETERLATPTARIRVTGYVTGLQDTEAKLTLSGTYDGETVILGSVTFFAYALSPGDRWETRPPQGQHRSQLIDYSIEYRDNYSDPAIPIDIVKRDADDPDMEIDAEWEIETKSTDRGNLRGLSKQSCVLNNSPNGGAGHRPVSVEGEIKNENTVAVTVTVIAKFYSEDRVVLTTPNSRETVPADTAQGFHINANLDPEQEKRIESCKVILAQGS